MDYQTRINNIIALLEPLAKLKFNQRSTEQKQQMEGLRRRLLQMPREYNSLIRSELTRLKI